VLQCGERLGCSRRPHEAIFSEQFGEGLSDGTEILDKLVMIARQPEERMHRMNHSWLGPFQDGHDLLFIHGNTAEVALCYPDEQLMCM
jgi:hypothetical protein